MEDLIHKNKNILQELISKKDQLEFECKQVQNELLAMFVRVDNEHNNSVSSTKNNVKLIETNAYKKSECIRKNEDCDYCQDLLAIELGLIANPLVNTFEKWNFCYSQYEKLSLELCKITKSIDHKNSMIVTQYEMLEVIQKDFYENLKTKKVYNI